MIFGFGLCCSMNSVGIKIIHYLFVHEAVSQEYMYRLFEFGGRIFMKLLVCIFGIRINISTFCNY